MKKLLLFLLLASYCFALNSKEIQSSVTSIDVSWALSGNGDAVFKTYAFPSTSQQLIDSHVGHAFTTQTDSFGNEIMVFNLQGSQTINAQLTASIDYTRPREKAVDFNQYLLQSSLVKIDSSLASQAASVTAGAKSDLEKAVLLTDWVHNFVSYDASFFGKNLDSLSVLQLRTGVCVEYSHLLLAALRSQKIPARLVAGYVYSGKAWDAHAWVEAVINGEWVSLDPTFGEAIVLDGSHVAFAYGRDHDDIHTELTTGFSLEEKPSLQTTSNKPFSKFFTASFKNAPSEVGSNSVVDFKVALKNLLQTPIAIPLTLVTPSQPESLRVEQLDSADKLVFLPANADKIVSFKTRFPKLDALYFYNFTIGLRSFGVQEDAQVIGKFYVGSNALNAIAIKDLSYEVSENQAKVLVTLKNYANETVSGTARLSLSSSEKTFSIPTQGEEKLEFSIPFDTDLHGVLTVTALGKTLTKQVILQKSPVEVAASATPDYAIPSDLLAGNGRFYLIGIVLILFLAILFLLKLKA